MQERRVMGEQLEEGSQSRKSIDLVATKSRAEDEKIAYATMRLICAADLSH